MEVTALLCDWAQEINGKLYIQGAGWNKIAADQPTSMAIAILVAVPWDQTNRKHVLRGVLLTEDGVPFLDPEASTVELRFEFEVGRPPGVSPGSDLNTPFTMSFFGISLPAGRYSVGLELNGEPVTSLPFEAGG